MIAKSPMVDSRGPGVAVHDGAVHDGVVMAVRYIDGVTAVPDQLSHAGTPR